MGWLRLEAAAFQDRAMRRAGMHGKMVFMAAIMLSKERDWLRNETRGWLPRREFDGLEIALHWGDSEANAAIYDAALARLASDPDPLIRAHPDGTGWWVEGWTKFQPDPTALARKRKERAAKWKAEMGNGHASHGDKSDKAKAGSSRPVTDEHELDCLCDECDVTTRDDDVNDTRRDESRSRDEDESRLHEGANGKEPAAPSPARPRAVASAAGRPGVAAQGSYVPGSIDASNAVADPSAKARAIRESMLRGPPSKPMRGPDPPPSPEAPRIADPEKIERLRAEVLAALAADDERRRLAAEAETSPP